MIRNLAMLAIMTAGLTACRPTAADIELMLGARGMNSDQAACIGDGLQVLTDDDWRTLAELAADVTKSEEELKQMTLADVQAKLFQLKDQRLMGTLLRTGMGCTVMHAGTTRSGLPRQEPESLPLPSPDANLEDEPFMDDDDSWLDESPS